MSEKKYGRAERRLELIKKISIYLEEVGLLEFSFRGAAKAADVSPMTLVRYFNNRDGLLDELLEYAFKEKVKDVESNWPGNLNNNLVESMRELILDLESEVYALDSNKLWKQLTLLAESPKAPNSMKTRYLNIYFASRDYIIALLNSQGLPIERATEVGSALNSFSNGVYRDYYLHQNKKIAQSSFKLMVKWLQEEMGESSI